MLEVFDGNVYVGSRNGVVSQLDPTTGAVQSTLTTFVGLHAHWLGRSPF
jgi:outer membrane protein assembly factor BamB